MTENVLVVGAGPTGLTVAIHCALNKVPVRVIDCGPGPATTSRALGLQSRGVEVLERIHALGDLPQRSRSLLTMYYNDGPRTVLALPLGRSVSSLEKPTLLISQAEVEGTLRRRLADLGVEVQWSTELVGAEQDERQVTAHCRVNDEDHAITTNWLIGCDGAHSAVRHLAKIDFPGTKIIDRLLMIDAKADWPYDPDGSVTWMDSDRMLSVTALPDSVWRVFCQAGPDTPEDLDHEEIVDRVLGEFSCRSGVPPETVSDIRWATEFRIHRRLAGSYRRGRILIAGDAAHIQSPTGGQGQNTGLGDAENLGWKLSLVAAGRADQRLLDTYTDERRALAAKVLNATSSAVDIMLPDKTWKRLLRDYLVMPAIRLPPVQRRLWQLASQLDISYRHGPLVLPSQQSRRFQHRPRPGDRMPDLRCQVPDGDTATLHAALDGRWAVVATARRTAEEHSAAAARLLGPERVVTLMPSSGWASDVALVRPDGHVGWRGGTAPETLTTWLTQVLRAG